MKFSEYFKPVCRVGDDHWERVEQSTVFVISIEFRQNKMTPNFISNIALTKMHCFISPIHFLFPINNVSLY